MLIVNRNKEIERREAEMERLQQENANLKAIVEYIGLCDYPEIFEEEGEEND